MLWWIGAFLVWVMSFAWIAYTMAEVVRGKWNTGQAFPAYLFHGATAVLALWLVLKALGA